MTPETATSQIKETLEHMRTVHFAYLLLIGLLLYLIQSRDFPPSLVPDLHSINRFRGRLVDLAGAPAQMTQDTLASLFQVNDSHRPLSISHRIAPVLSIDGWESVIDELWPRRRLSLPKDSSWLLARSPLSALRDGFVNRGILVSVSRLRIRGPIVVETDSQPNRTYKDLEDAVSGEKPSRIAGVSVNEDGTSIIIIFESTIRYWRPMMRVPLEKVTFTLPFPNHIREAFDIPDDNWDRLRDLNIVEAISLVESGGMTGAVSVFGISIEREDSIVVVSISAMLVLLYLAHYMASLTTYVMGAYEKGVQIEPFPLPWIGSEGGPLPRFLTLTSFLAPLVFITLRWVSGGDALSFIVLTTWFMFISLPLIRKSRSLPTALSLIVGTEVWMLSMSAPLRVIVGIARRNNGGHRSTDSTGHLPFTDPLPMGGGFYQPPTQHSDQL